MKRFHVQQQFSIFIVICLNAFHYSVQRLPRNSRLIAMFRPRPALALLSALYGEFHCVRKMSRPNDVFAGKGLSYMPR